MALGPGFSGEYFHLWKRVLLSILLSLPLYHYITTCHCSILLSELMGVRCMGVSCAGHWQHTLNTSWCPLHTSSPGTYQQPTFKTSLPHFPLWLFLIVSFFLRPLSPLCNTSELLILWVPVDACLPGPHPQHLVWPSWAQALHRTSSTSLSSPLSCVSQLTIFTFLPFCFCMCFSNTSTYRQPPRFFSSYSAIFLTVSSLTHSLIMLE